MWLSIFGLTGIFPRQWSDHNYDHASHRTCKGERLTRTRTRLGRVAEANYVISAFCPRQSRKCANHCSLCVDCRRFLVINQEGIKTVSGIFQEYAERLRNKCGFTKLDSASCPSLVRALVDARYQEQDPSFQWLISKATPIMSCTPKLTLARTHTHTHTHTHAHTHAHTHTHTRTHNLMYTLANTHTHNTSTYTPKIADN